MTECDVVVVGAGPDGLEAGAHLGGIKGLDVRVFGEPMEFWKSYMPTGMFLRSPWSASHISDPEKALTMDGFHAQQKGDIPVPIPLARFVDYGFWFQKNALPALARWRARMQKRGPLWKLLYARTDVGPAGVSRIVAIPDSVKYFPRFMQNRFRTRSLRPAGARWLIDRMKDVKITTSRHVKYAEQKGDALQLQLNDGSIQEVDHVVLGTGYKVDVSRYPFLSPDLIPSLQTTEGFPHLTRGMESSIPGLHFLGAPAAWTYGPLMYFVAVTDFAGHNLARYIGQCTTHTYVS